MKNKHALICSFEALLKDVPCDFAGVAIQNAEDTNIKWRYAAGNRTDKYKRITVRYGKGIAGRVISTGSPMHIEAFPNRILGKELEYPIMLAEKLVSAYAVPIHYKGRARGVLLVGRREESPFSKEEQRIVRSCCHTIEAGIEDE